ncbi:MAG TPA: MBL fold metallo-hydrolase [Planctomycetota bacterium]|nr:MBL fold metallo-hydrolase [Planctomycetota bacterium]
MNLFDLPVLVDRFSADAELFVLSHYHRDHMDGLGAGWRRGPLLCSPITASLLSALDALPPQTLRVIQPDEMQEISVAGQTLCVTALEANHCPGALMFVFECRGRKIIYTGDFRLNHHLRQKRTLLAGADVLYVDSTYASPEYKFPTQEQSVEMVLQAVRANVEKEIMLAIYTIGKSRILQALFDEFRRPVYVSKEKLAAYNAMGYGNLVTASRKDAGFIGYSREYFDRYFRWTRERNPSNCLVIYPSGMCTGVRPREGFFYVPYSEHCDWHEFSEFVEMVAAREVVKT